MKAWYLSRTLWVNFVAVLVIIAQAYFGAEIAVDAEKQAVILALVNTVLRFRTNEKVTLR